MNALILPHNINKKIVRIVTHRRIGIGFAFLYNKQKLIATAKHCVILNRADAIINNISYPCKLIGQNIRTDLAILEPINEIDQLECLELDDNLLSLSHDDKLAYVCNIKHTLDRSEFDINTITSYNIGQVNKRHKMYGELMNFNIKDSFIPGYSGSPIINSRNKVLAVLTHSILENSFNSGCGTKINYDIVKKIICRY